MWTDEGRATTGHCPIHPQPGGWECHSIFWAVQDGSCKQGPDMYVFGVDKLWERRQCRAIRNGKLKLCSIRMRNRQGRATAGKRAGICTPTPATLLLQFEIVGPVLLYFCFYFLKGEKKKRRAVVYMNYPDFLYWQLIQ